MFDSYDLTSSVAWPPGGTKRTINIQKPGGKRLPGNGAVIKCHLWQRGDWEPSRVPRIVSGADLAQLLPAGSMNDWRIEYDRYPATRLGIAVPIAKSLHLLELERWREHQARLFTQFT